MPNIVSAIVGQRFYPGATQVLADLPAESTVTLVREPDNRYDSNAIKVLVGETQVGHIARADAALLAPIMDSRTSVTAKLFPLAPVVVLEWETP